MWVYVSEYKCMWHNCNFCKCEFYESLSLSLALSLLLLSSFIRIIMLADIVCIVCFLAVCECEYHDIIITILSICSQYAINVKKKFMKKLEYLWSEILVCCYCCCFYFFLMFALRLNILIVKWVEYVYVWLFEYSFNELRFIKFLNWT